MSQHNVASCIRIYYRLCCLSQAMPCRVKTLGLWGLYSFKVLGISDLSRSVIKSLCVIPSCQKQTLSYMCRPRSPCITKSRSPAHGRVRCGEQCTVLARLHLVKDAHKHGRTHSTGNNLFSLSVLQDMGTRDYVETPADAAQLSMTCLMIFCLSPARCSPFFTTSVARSKLARG